MRVQSSSRGAKIGKDGPQLKKWTFQMATGRGGSKDHASTVPEISEKEARVHAMYFHEYVLLEVGQAQVIPRSNNSDAGTTVYTYYIIYISYIKYT